LQDGNLSTLLDRFAMMQDPKMNNPEDQAKRHQTFGALLGMFQEVVATLPNCEKIAPKVQQIDMMKLMITFIAMAEPMRNGFQCLSHGDGWLNNMMFKSADGNFIDCKMLDFQLSYWGSPAADLIYLLISSVADDVKVAHFDELIEFYHEVLVDSLTKLNYEHQIPTLCELHVDMLDKGALGRH
jgi:aminoglycoside phosphotransferase (APT) family kinase protein